MISGSKKIDLHKNICLWMNISVCLSENHSPCSVGKPVWYWKKIKVKKSTQSPPKVRKGTDYSHKMIGRDWGEKMGRGVVWSSALWYLLYHEAGAP